MLSHHLFADPTPLFGMDRLVDLDGVQIVVSRDLRDLTLVDRLADVIDAIVNQNAARRTRITAGVTSAGRRRIDADHAAAIGEHRKRLGPILEAMLDAGIEISVAVEICPCFDTMALGPVRVGSLYVYPAAQTASP